MALIGSIRKRSALLIIIIGVALAAFVLGDFVKSKPRQTVNIGSVDGEEITIMDFNRQVDQNIENTKAQQKKDRLTQQETYSVRDQTWEQLVREYIMSEQYEDLGIQVTSDELFQLVQGPNPHQIIKRYFTNPQTGVYDKAAVLNYLQNLDKMSPQAKAQWIELENYIKEDRKMSKYNNMISKAYYIPERLAKQYYSEDNDKAKIEYVAIKYANVSDSLVNVTDEDYKEYYEKNKFRYEQKASRDIDYVVFTVRPSAEDMGAASKEIEAIHDDFVKTKNPISFVNANSDDAYDSTWFKEGALPVQIDSLMFNSEIGTVSEPYLTGYTYHIGRLVNTQMRPDSIKATHILIAYSGAMRASEDNTRTALQAKLLADSLLNVVEKNPNKIESLAKEFSDDGSVAQNSGDLGWFADGAMVPSFNEAAINTKEGGITMAESAFGFHIIKVTGKKDISKKVRVAMINREVLASNQTYQDEFAKASKLASENHTQAEFEQAIKDQRLSKRTAPKVSEMSHYIAGVDNARQVIRWAFNEDTELGQVSEVFDLDGSFLVATVTAIYEEGFPELEDVKQRIRTFVYNEKKGEYLVNKLQPFGADFDKIVAEVGGEKDMVEAVNFSSRNIKGFGRENEVLGTIFSKSEPTTLNPIAGVGGAFVVKIDKFTPAVAAQDYTFTKNKYANAVKQRVDQDFVYRALKKVSDIEDNRLTFY